MADRHRAENPGDEGHQHEAEAVAHKGEAALTAALSHAPAPLARLGLLAGDRPFPPKAPKTGSLLGLRRRSRHCWAGRRALRRRLLRGCRVLLRPSFFG